MSSTIGKESNQPANPLQVLRNAANKGWEDLETGRFTDVIKKSI